MDKRNIFIFGDSHSRSFFGKKEQIIFDNFIVHNKFKSKVSMSGITNPKSISNYHNEVVDFINSRVDDTDIYCFKLGQVDIEYVYNFKKYIKMENIDFIDFCNNIIDKYLEFLSNLKKNIIVCGPNLPNYDKSVSAIYETLNIQNTDEVIQFKNINENIMMFNEILKEKCGEKNILFADFIPLLKNDENMLKTEFIGVDHHIKGCEFANNIRHFPEDYGKNVNKIFIDELLICVKNFTPPTKLNFKNSS